MKGLVGIFRSTDFEALNCERATRKRTYYLGPNFKAFRAFLGNIILLRCSNIRRFFVADVIYQMPSENLVGQVKVYRAYYIFIFQKAARYFCSPESLVSGCSAINYPTSPFTTLEL